MVTVTVAPSQATQAPPTRTVTPDDSGPSPGPATRTRGRRPGRRGLSQTPLSLVVQVASLSEVPVELASART